MAGILGDVLGIISSGRQAGSVSSANIAAEHGVLGATGAAQNDIQSALYQQGQPLYSNALTSLNPYRMSGYQGTAELQGYAANAPTFNPSSTTQLANFASSNPQFSFNPSQFFNSPAYQFEEQQGTNAITNAASAMGLGASGNTLRSIDQYTQGLAGQYYNQAFQQAQQTFGTNEQATLANLGALYGQQQGTFETNQQATLQNIQALLQSGQFGQQQMGALTNAASNFYLGGNEALGGVGMQGATTAGNFAVNAGLANAAGIAGQYNNIASLGTDIGGLITGLGV